MGKQHVLRRRAALATALLVGALVAVWPAAPAGAATGGTEPPTFTGGQEVAPYTGNSQPAISSRGDVSLVVWQKAVGSAYQIWGRLISSDAGIQFEPFRISQGDKSSYFPDVAWNGSNWLVVWQMNYSATDVDVRAQRIGTGGQSLGSNFDVAGTSKNEMNPAVSAGANGQWLVVWQDEHASECVAVHIVLQWISATGTKDSSPFQVTINCVDTGTNYAPDVAWNGKEHLIVWTRRSGTESSIKRFWLDSPDGGYSSTLVTSDTAHPVGNAAVASDGKGFLVTYEHNRGGSTGVDIEARKFDGPFAEQSPAFLISARAGNEAQPAIAYDGNFLIVWRDRRAHANGDLYGTLVRPDRSLTDPSGFLVTNYYPYNAAPALSTGTADPGTYNLAWETQPAGEQVGVVSYGIEYAPK
jgi:hypothetical protein